MFDGERTVKVNFDKTHLFALFEQVVDGFFGNFGAAAHHDEDIRSVRRAYIVEDVVRSAGDFGDFRHVFFNNFRNGVVVFVCRFPVLEVDVRVLGGAVLNRVFRIQGAGSEFFDIFSVQKFVHLFIRDFFYFVDFMAGAETVEEVQERHFGFESGEVGDQSQIHNFLNGIAGQHGEARLSARHDVLMVAENAEGVSRKSPCRNVENARQQFAGDFVHVRYHQQQALAGCEGGGQSARRERAVHGARRARFRLQFGHSDRLAEKVFLAGSRPFVRRFAHRGGRRDRVDGGYVAERICYVARGGVAVYGLFDCHIKVPPKKLYKMQCVRTHNFLCIL